MRDTYDEFLDDQDFTISIPGATCVRETEKALLIEFDANDDKWIPKSVIDASSEVKEEDDKGTLVIKERFAVKEGLDEYEMAE
jgi:hypothetical protein